MAKVADVFLNGTIGNVVFYRRMGTNCSRSGALHVKQSEAMKKRSANFVIVPEWKLSTSATFSLSVYKLRIAGGRAFH